MDTKEISKIVIKNRYRKDLGDLADLKNSIKEIGLLHPIVINSNNELIAGQRRIMACKELGWKEVPVNIINLDKLVKGEHDENVVRKNFTSSEAVAIWQAMESYQAKDRDEKGKFTRPSDSDGREPRNRAAKVVGMGHDTLSKAKAVVDAAKKEPEKYKNIQSEMDTSGNINKAYKEINKIKRQEELDKQVTEVQEDKKYRVIYADPPWKYSDELVEGYGAATHHYPLLSIDELCNLKIGNRTVSEISEDNSVLFLWVTSPMLSECWEIIKEWGFKYKSSFIWDKVKHNYGHYNSVRHEFLLVCTKGSCLPDNSKLHDSVVEIERTSKHSEKPEYFRTEIIDKLYKKGSRIELFNRGDMPDHWDSWGKEIQKDAI